MKIYHSHPPAHPPPHSKKNFEKIDISLPRVHLQLSPGYAMPGAESQHLQIGTEVT